MKNTCEKTKKICKFHAAKLVVRNLTQLIYQINIQLQNMVGNKILKLLVSLYVSCPGIVNMKNCRCGNKLDSKGYCHECKQYDASYGNDNFFEERCSICQKRFADLSQYLDHLEKHPQCKYCKKRFISNKGLNRHYESYHKCSLCNEYCSNVSEHMIWNHPYCEFCNKRFLNRDLLTQHMKVHSRCIYCDEYFQDNSHLYYHLQRTHKCRVCSEYFTNPVDHLHADHPYCKLCNQYFMSEKSYKQHNKLEHTHECIYCGKTYKIKIKLDIHLLNVHKCSYCNEFFENLQQHSIDNHFYCKLCRNTFFTGSQYAAHINQHATLDPIKYNKDGTVQCLFCERSFIDETARNQHIEDYHAYKALFTCKNRP